MFHIVYSFKNKSLSSPERIYLYIDNITRTVSAWSETVKEGNYKQ